MWIVRLALRRPFSIAVMTLLMLVLGVLAYTRMNADIFPAIDMPVVILVWNYPGLSAIDMERRVVTYSERVSASVVNDIEHMESESIAGAGVIKIYFHPGATVASGIAQMSALSQTLLSITTPLTSRWRRSTSSATHSRSNNCSTTVPTSSAFAFTPSREFRCRHRSVAAAAP
jgi:multidrug efflux pump subunit AcrB